MMNKTKIFQTGLVLPLFLLLLTLNVGKAAKFSFTAGGHFNCVTEKNGISCWGDDRYQQVSGKPKVMNLRQLSAGNNHACALNDKKIRCWGKCQKGECKVPRLTRPTQVAVGYEHSCALHSYGVKCWGSNRYGQLRVPKLINPVKIYARGNYSCAIHKKGVRCWGSNKHGTLNVPKLRNVKELALGWWHACALDNKNGLSCWGNDEFGQVSSFPESLGKVRKIVAGWKNTCALDEEGLVCWGDDRLLRGRLWHRHQIADVVLGEEHVCIMDGNKELKCTGNNDHRQCYPPALDFGHIPMPFGNGTFFQDFSEYINELSRYVYSFDQKFLLEIASAWRDDAAPAEQFFFAKVLNEYVKNLDYESLSSVKEGFLTYLGNYILQSGKYDLENGIRKKFGTMLAILLPSFKTSLKFYNKEQKKVVTSYVSQMGNLLAMERISLEKIMSFVRKLDPLKEVVLEGMDSPYLRPRAMMQMKCFSIMEEF